MPRMTAPSTPPVHSSGGTEANEARGGGGARQTISAAAASVSEVTAPEIAAAQSTVAPRWANWELTAA